MTSEAKTCARAALNALEAARDGRRHKRWHDAADWLGLAAQQIAAAWEVAAEDGAAPVRARWQSLAENLILLEEQRGQGNTALRGRLLDVYQSLREHGLETLRALEREEGQDAPSKEQEP